MRSFIRRAVIVVAAALVGGVPGSVALAQTTNDSSQSQVNRPLSVGPVRLARATREQSARETAAPQALAAVDRAKGSLPLAPPSKAKAAGLNRPAAPSPSRTITTVLGSLGVVLGLFFLAVWFTRKVRPKGQQSLPKEAVELLGRLPLAGRQQMHLVRVGGKLLLLSVTPAGAETLTEITDSQEVERLCGLCQMSQPGSITETFRQVLSQFEQEPAPAGFVGEPTDEQRQADLAARNRRRAARSVR